MCCWFSSGGALAPHIRGVTGTHVSTRGFVVPGVNFHHLVPLLVRSNVTLTHGLPSLYEERLRLLVKQHPPRHHGAPQPQCRRHVRGHEDQAMDCGGYNNGITVGSLRGCRRTGPW